MVIPSRKDLEIPLLLEIEKVGGQANWRTLFQPIAAHFPGLTGKDLEHPARLRRAGFSLSKKGELISKGEIWTMTAMGQARLQQARLQALAIQSPAYKRRLQQENHELAQFISSLVRRPREEDHSLDELELHKMEAERKRNHVVPGSFETGKHR